MIPYGRQEITDSDIQAVVDVLRSDFITQGPAIEQFEKAIAEYCGVKHAVAVSSCTAGLHLACMVLGLNDESLGWTVPNTFVASANAVRYCGGSVDFVDIDRNTYNLSLSALEKKLEQGTVPDVLIPVHFSGESCEMNKIAKLAQKYDFQVIEDAAHCIGASYEDSHVGACQYSDMCVFSFHPVKIITTGEGGVITTNSDEYYRKICMLRTHGITKERKHLKNQEQGSWFFEQQHLGFNYRMTDIQAALGLSQLDRLDGYVDERRRLARRYHEKLSQCGLRLPLESDRSSWHLYVVGVGRSKTNKSREEVYNFLREADIGVNVHYIPVHTHPYYQSLGFKTGDFPDAESYYDEAITLPLYPGLTDKEQNYICEKVKEVLI